jgi:hypothetical protein
LLFACKTEHEFGQRGGGLFPILVDSARMVHWPEKAEKVDVLIERHVAQLEKAISKRILF